MPVRNEEIGCGPAQHLDQNLLEYLRLSIRQRREAVQRSAATLGSF
jgi:hypothetical protein